MKPKLIAFHGKPEIKEVYLLRVTAHEKADEIIKGRYWEGGKGCAVGCTIHSRNHGNYETELGIPRVLAKLQDMLFERMPNIDAKTFPRRFLEAIPIGADLSNVWKHFMIWILTDETSGVIKFAKKEETRISIKNVSNAFLKSITEPVSRDEWSALRKNAAYAAAAAAYDAAAAGENHAKLMGDKLIQPLSEAK